MKIRLIAGTINHWADDDEWLNFHLDVNPRPIWDRSLSMGVLPDFVVDLAEPSEMAVFRDGMFNEVRLHHVLEHMAPPWVPVALAQIHRILTPGGILDIEVPDIEKVIRAYALGELDFPGLQQWVYGEFLNDGHRAADTHLSAWSESKLADALRDAGFQPGGPAEAGYAARYWAVRR